MRRAISNTNIIAEDGVPETATAYQENYQVWNPSLNHGEGGYIAMQRTAYHNWFTDIEVRSLTLVSPVAMMGVDAAIHVLSPGLIPNFNLGWDTESHISHTLVLRDNDRDNILFPEADITGTGLTVVDLPFNHGGIGHHATNGGVTWTSIVDHLLNWNVPVLA